MQGMEHTTECPATEVAESGENTDEVSAEETGYEWQTEYAEVIREAEAIFKACSRGDKVWCETLRLKKAINANKTLCARLETNHLWSQFYKRLGEGRPEWQITNTARGPVYKISKQMLVQSYIDCVIDPDTDVTNQENRAMRLLVDLLHLLSDPDSDQEGTTITARTKAWLKVFRQLALERECNPEQLFKMPILFCGEYGAAMESVLLVDKEHLQACCKVRSDCSKVIFSNGAWSQVIRGDTLLHVATRVANLDAVRAIFSRYVIPLLCISELRWCVPVAGLLRIQFITALENWHLTL